MTFKKAKQFTEMERGELAMDLHWDPVRRLLPGLVNQTKENGFLSREWINRKPLHLSIQQRTELSGAIQKAILDCCADVECHSRESLRAVLIDRAIYRSLSTLAGVGFFGEAFEAFERSFKAVRQVVGISQMLATMVKAACEMPQEKDPLNQVQKLNLLCRSDAWDPDGFAANQEIMGNSMQDLHRPWEAALTMLCKIATQKPEAAHRCSTLIRLWVGSVWPQMDRKAYFCDRHGEELGRQKVKDGVVEAGCWSAMPLEMKMGIALSLEDSSKMGSWSARQLIEESFQEPKGKEGDKIRGMVCLIMWLSADKKRIDAVEERFGDAASSTLLKLGIQTVIENDEASMLALIGAERLKKTSGSWALKIMEKAGVEDPSDAFDFHNPDRWLEMVELLKASRLSKSLKKVVPALKAKKSVKVRI